MATTNSTVISTDPLSSSSSSLSSLISTTSSIISSTSTSSSTTSSSTSTSTSSTTLSATTIVSTLTVTRSESSTQVPTTITRTSTSSISTVVPITTSSSATSTPTSIGSGNSNNDGSGGLSTAGKTAVAVVVPVVVVALLVLAGILLYRRRKQKKEAEEARRKEIQDYGYNPNDDPTLPTVMQESHSEMAEDTSGYRGWGAAGAFSNRKTSTTLSGGMTHAQMSDAGSNFYGGGPHSPPIPSPDGNSGDGLVNRRETMGSDDLGALGVAPISASQPIKRGPSNASSAYSNGARSDVSDEQPPLPAGQGYGDYYNNGAQYGSYTQHGPYGDGSYGGAQENGMPVVRDVSARRNTRIQQGGTYQQANSGIAQNF